MHENSGGRVIPFPRSELRSALGPSPVADGPGERLQRAIAGLERAVSAQRDAVGEWRDALGGLRRTMSTLRETLVSYDARLCALRNQVESVQKAARGLEAWADGALAPSQIRRDKPQ